jgi:hypothetical protein
MKVVRLSSLRTGRLYPPGNIPGTHFCYRLSRPQCYSATDRIMSLKKSTNTIGNRTRYLRAFSLEPQPTAPPLAPKITCVCFLTLSPRHCTLLFRRWKSIFLRKFDRHLPVCRIVTSQNTAVFTVIGMKKSNTYLWINLKHCGVST